MTGGSSALKYFLDSGSRLPRTGYGVRNDEKRLIQRSYKMMSIVKPHLLRWGEFTNYAATA